MGYIYKITNLINQKIYIGKTEHTIEERWKGHLQKARIYTNRYLYDAMNHYGYDNFKIEVVEECDNELLNEREIYWISYYDSFNNGYNMTVGGDGGNTWVKNQHKEETSKKLSKALTGLKRTPEQRKRMSVAQQKLAEEKSLPIDKEQLLIDLQTCSSIEEIYLKYNCSRRTLYNRCNKYFGCSPTKVRGDRFTHTNTNKKELNKEELLNKVRDGLTLKELANYFEVSRETIRRRLQEYFNKTITELRNDQ